MFFGRIPKYINKLSYLRNLRSSNDHKKDLPGKTNKTRTKS